VGRLLPPRTILAALTIAACMVGDTGGPQLCEACLTPAAIPAGALAAQTVLITPVERHQLLHGLPQTSQLWSSVERLQLCPQNALKHKPSVGASFLLSDPSYRGGCGWTPPVGRAVSGVFSQPESLTLPRAHLDTFLDTGAHTTCGFQL
jgi:hypothetical protein